MRSSTLLSFFALACASIAVSVQGAPISEINDDSTVEKRMISPRITFYSGNQLNNPACGGPNPRPSDMIAAVMEGGAFECGDHIHIKHGKKSVKVRVVDYCESCSSRAVDLSPGAFEKLASLDAGVITGAQMWLS